MWFRDQFLASTSRPHRYETKTMLEHPRPRPRPQKFGLETSSPVRNITENTFLTYDIKSNENVTIIKPKQ